MRMTRDPWHITRDMFLSDEEVEALFAHVAGRVLAGDPDPVTARVDEVITRSLLLSGLRNSEFCRLTLADTVIGTGKSVFLVRGTPREDRTVFVPQALSDLLRRYVSEIRPEFLPEGASPRDRALPLVLNERGRPYERTGLYRRVVRILSEVGLAERASVQFLRHTYGLLAYKRSGGNLLFVQRQLGHSHPLVTSIYARFVDESYENLADAVGGLTADRRQRNEGKKNVSRKGAKAQRL
jgi:integrase/recombinase XerD